MNYLPFVKNNFLSASRYRNDDDVDDVDDDGDHDHHDDDDKNVGHVKHLIAKALNIRISLSESLSWYNTQHAETEPTQN